MKLERVQRGLGLWSGLFVFGAIAFVALCAIKVGPLYLNEIQLRKAVNDVANTETTSSGQIDVAGIQRALQRRWDVDYIGQLDPRDIQVVRKADGVVLSYDYEARAHLFANLFVVVHFQNDVPLRAAAD